MPYVSNSPFGNGLYRDTSKKKLQNQMNALAEAMNRITVAGQIAQWPHSTAPKGWLLCQGQAVSRKIYEQLAAAFGADGFPFGAGDGVTTFNLPDFRGKAAIGGGSYTDGHSNAKTFALGEARGYYNHTLTQEETPSHAHSITLYSQPNTGAYNGSGYFISQQGGGNTKFGSRFSFASGAIGGGEGHNNMQPVLVVNYIIKY